jgi:hypothetical protein
MGLRFGRDVTSHLKGRAEKRPSWITAVINEFRWVHASKVGAASRHHEVPYSDSRRFSLIGGHPPRRDFIAIAVLPRARLPSVKPYARQDN